MAKTSASIDLASKVPTSYVTDITNSNGIFVHEKSDSSVSPTDSGANGVQITDKVKIIRDGRSVAEYGEDIIIGKKLTSEDSTHEVESLLTLNKNSMCLLSGAKDYLSDNKVFEISINTLKKRYTIKVDGTTANTTVVKHTKNNNTYIDSITITDSDLISKMEQLKQTKYDEIELNISNCVISGNNIILSFSGEGLEDGYKTQATNVIVDIIYIPNLSAKSYTSTYQVSGEYFLERAYFSLPENTTTIKSVYNNTTGTAITNYSFNAGTHILQIPSGTPTSTNVLDEGTEIIVEYNKSMGYFYSLGKRDLTETGDFSVATGYNCYVKGANSFGGGTNTYVSGNNSFGYGYGTDDTECVTVSGSYSGAIGRGLTVNGSGSFACGTYNYPSSSYLFMVGNGKKNNYGNIDLNNAFWVARSGNARVANSLQVGSQLQVAGEMRSSNVAGNATTPMFWYDTKTKSNISITANGTNTGLSCDVTMNNHLPMGVVGIRILNSSSGGANAASCNIYIYATVNNSNESHITFSIKNNASSAAKVDVEFRVFYIAKKALSSQLS